MELFKVLSVKDAQNKMMDYFSDLNIDTEEIEITQALDRVVAKDVFSNIDVPHFKRSTVDGYAVNSKDTHGASESLPIFLEIMGESEMGKGINCKVERDGAVYVPTGGMIPEGADSVVMIEYVEKFDDTSIAVYRPSTNKENMVDIGDDIKKGEAVLSKGLKLRSQDIGVLSSIGIEKVTVYKRPKMTIISTGDEIIGPNDELLPGKIRDINTYTLSALSEKLGLEVVGRYVVKDNFDLLKTNLESALDKSDIVILSGGSSVGTKDITTDVINATGEPGVFLHGVAIKPGKGYLDYL